MKILVTAWRWCGHRDTDDSVTCSWTVSVTIIAAEAKDENENDGHKNG